MWLTVCECFVFRFGTSSDRLGRFSINFPTVVGLYVFPSFAFFPTFIFLLLLFFDEGSIYVYKTKPKKPIRHRAVMDDPDDAAKRTFGKVIYEIDIFKQMDFSYIYSGPVNTVENINEIVMCSSGLLFHIYLVKSENISLCLLCLQRQQQSFGQKSILCLCMSSHGYSKDTDVQKHRSFPRINSC